MLLRVLLLLIVFAVALAPRSAQAQEPPRLLLRRRRPKRKTPTPISTCHSRISRDHAADDVAPAALQSAFRVTHRFTRPLGQGDFGNLAEDLFGLDSGA